MACPLAGVERKVLAPAHFVENDPKLMLANVQRAMAITSALNRLTFNDAKEIRALFSDLIRKEVDESFLLIPPFYTAGGDEIRVGRNVFVNQNCTFYDLGRLDIADDVMIGPNVSIITAGHPLEPSQRRAITIGKLHMKHDAIVVGQPWN
jgi:acetyltransferase-like isoleucine patch superfamily enzyme